MRGQWSNDYGQQQMSIPRPRPPSGSDHTSKQVDAFETVIRYASKYAQGTPQVSLSRMQLALHGTRRTFSRHCFRAWCARDMSASSSVKTRRPPAWQCRDSTVYGFMDTAMHEVSIAPTTAVFSHKLREMHAVFMLRFSYSEELHKTRATMEVHHIFFLILPLNSGA